MNKYIALAQPEFGGRVGVGQVIWGTEDPSGVQGQRLDGVWGNGAKPTNLQLILDFLGGIN